MINEAYFEKLNFLGDLYLEKTLFYFEEPILFVCLSENKKQRYLCLCSEVRSLQRWIISLINIPTIVKLIQNEITVFDAFQSGEATKYIVEWANDYPAETIRQCNLDAMDLLDLPKESTRLKVSNGEFNDYIRFLQHEVCTLEKQSETISVKQEVRYNDIPFYSTENQARLLAAKEQMEKTGGTIHELIEVDDG